VLSTSYNLNILSFIALSSLVILLAYGTLRFIGGKTSINGTFKNMKILEKLSLGNEKSFLLLEVNNLYYFVYITKNGIEIIDKFDSLTTNIVNNAKDSAIKSIIKKTNK